MVKIYNFRQDKFNLPTIIIIIALIIGFFHFFSYLFPFTDNAFVATNVQTVAADIEGYITKIYIKNGQRVTKNAPLFKVFETPYYLKHNKAKASYEEALTNIDVLKEELYKNQEILAATQAILAKTRYEYSLKSSHTVERSVSVLEVRKLNYDIESLTNKIRSLQRQVTINRKQILQQEKKVAALKAEMDNAKVNMFLTTVRAGSDGVIDNMYLSVGTPVKRHQPLFSFINTDEWYIQANFNETDLRFVRPGNKVIILLRMYYFQKIFHGIIVNNVWAANRQITAPNNQQQTVLNDNQWLNLPQRLPLQIKVLDPDPRYPLNPGASAYVYIRT